MIRKHPSVFAHSAFLVMTSLVLSTPALSQGGAASYPSRVVSIIVPYPAGGPTDGDTRLYAQKLTDAFGKPFVIDYKPGAGSAIGINFIAKAAPDGHTLGSVTSGFSVVPALSPKLPFDPIKDIATVSLMHSRSTVLLVHPTFPAKTWPEYVSYVKANPGKINFATSGIGGIFHMVGAWLHSEIGSEVTYVHYKGAAPAQTDLIAGRIDAMPSTVYNAIRAIKAGKLRALAGLSMARSPLLPDLQTVAEQGVDGFDYSGWGGIITTGGTSKPILDKLSAELAKIAKAPDMLKRASLDGTILIGSTPEEFGKVVAREIARWKKVVKENNIKAGS